MADLSVMGFLNEETQQETEYNLKDATARESINTINSKIPSAASSNNKLVDTTAMNDAIGQAVSAAYKPAGNKTVAELTSSLLVAANRGKVYNMTDAGTTTADFVEGAGNPIRVGDDVGICEPTTGTFKFNILSGFIAVDTNPTQGSANPVSSGGVYSEFAGMKNGQSIDSFGDVETALADKVDKVAGKGLSTNDYNNTAKGIVDNIQSNVIANTKLIKDTVGWSGKNKCPRFSNYSQANVVFTVDSDGVVDITTSAAASANVWNVIDSGLPVLENGKKYKVSGFGTSTNQDGYVVGDNNGADYVYVHDEGSGGEFTYDSSKPLKKIQIGLRSGQTASHTKLSPMIYDADILDPTYEPYFGSTAFPRSEQAVLGAKNIFDKNQIPEGADNNAVSTVLDTGLKISNESAATHSSVRFNKIYVKPNTNYAISCNIETVSGKSGILVRGTNDGSTYTYLLNKVDESPTGKQRYIFNTGTSTQLRINLYCSVGTSETGEVNYKELMITLADDNDDTYAPYAMTNRELTEKVKKEKVTGVTWTATATVKDFNIARQGSVVCIRGYINPTEAVAAWGEVATGLPKPMIGAYMSDTKTSGAFSIEATGDVGHMIAATVLNVGTQYTFAFTYLAAD